MICHAFQRLKGNLHFRAILLIKEVKMDMGLSKAIFAKYTYGMPLLWLEKEYIPRIPEILAILDCNQYPALFDIKQFIVKNDSFLQMPWRLYPAVHRYPNIRRQIIYIHICKHLFTQSVLPSPFTFYMGCYKRAINVK